MILSANEPLWHSPSGMWPHLLLQHNFFAAPPFFFDPPSQRKDSRPWSLSPMADSMSSPQASTPLQTGPGIDTHNGCRTKTWSSHRQNPMSRNPAPGICSFWGCTWFGLLALAQLISCWIGCLALVWFGLAWRAWARLGLAWLCLARVERLWFGPGSCSQMSTPSIKLGFEVCFLWKIAESRPKVDLN